MSRVVASTSNSGLRTPGAPTKASTAVPPRAGLGAVATGWQPITNATVAIAAAAASRLLEMSPHPYVGQRAHQEGNDQDPGRPVNLPLESAAGSIPAAQPTVTAADGATKAGRLGRLHQYPRHQQQGEHRLDDDERVLDLGHRPLAHPDRAEPRLDRRPVQRVEPCSDVVGPLVLILQVVGVLPNVDAENRRQTFHIGAVLVRVRLDRHLALLVREQPGPSAAELADGSLLKLLLERVVAAERALDGVAQPARRVAAAAGAHDAPEDRVIRVAAGVVADGCPDVLGHRVDPPQEVLDRLGAEVGVLFDSGVVVVDVGRVMLVVMDLHRLSVDVRLERIEGVWKRWDRECHGGNLP